MCTGLEVLAAVSSVAGAASSIKGMSGGKPNLSQDLSKQQEDDKRKLAKQKQQRKPTETFLTGGQGLANGGETLG